MPHEDNVVNVRIPRELHARIMEFGAEYVKTGRDSTFDARVMLLE